MAIPAAVDSLLRENNIQYDVEALPPHTLLPADAARAVMMYDGQHKLHVLYPAHSLLDVNALRRMTGLQLNAMPHDHVEQLCLRRNFAHLPALPGVMDVPTVVDKKLLSGSTIALISGEASNLLHLSVDQFKQSLRDVTLGDYSIELSTLHQGGLDAVDDVEKINQAVASFTQLRIKQRLEETLEISPLPDTAARILKLRVDPNADVRHLTTLVETDPPLAAQVISWAISPYYGYTGKVKSVHDAIVRVLGFDVVLNLALGLALGKCLSLPKDAPRGFTSYWHQAVFCATAVEALTGCIPAAKRPEVGVAYLAGLLHNFGYLIMAEVFPPHFSSYCRYQEANPLVSYTVIERFLLGVTRDQMASWLLGLWSMPEEVCRAVRFQNGADYAGPDSEYANLIYIAMRLLRRFGIGDAPLESIPAEMFERLHLDPERAVLAIQHVVDASEDIISRM
jgi:HD-like signal output (HDOD) protein/prolyl-tRNA editing enzyme YbaK/EbsC (Cys-tRNA(Pro) deacylase)